MTRLTSEARKRWNSVIFNAQGRRWALQMSADADLQTLMEQVSSTTGELE